MAARVNCTTFDSIDRDNHLNEYFLALDNHIWCCESLRVVHRNGMRQGDGDVT